MILAATVQEMAGQATNKIVPFAFDPESDPEADVGTVADRQTNQRLQQEVSQW